MADHPHKNRKRRRAFGDIALSLATQGGKSGTGHKTSHNTGHNSGHGSPLVSRKRMRRQRRK